MKRFETERLILRQVQESDFDSFRDFFADEKTAHFIGGIRNEEEAWRTMAFYLGHWQLKGYGYMVIEEKSSGDFVGCCGLWNSPTWPEMEMGYWMQADKQGQGYATEAAERIKQFAFEEIGANTLVSYIDKENIASIKVAKRLGGVYDKTIELSTFGPHHVYRYNK